MGWKPHCALALLIVALAGLLLRDARQRRPEAPGFGGGLRALAGHTLGEVQLIAVQPATGEDFTLERDSAGRWWLTAHDQPRRRADAMRVACLLDAIEFARYRPGADRPDAAASVRWGTIRLIQTSAALDIGVWLPNGDGEDAVGLAVGDGSPDPTDASILRTLLAAHADNWLDPRLLPLDPKRISRLALESTNASAELVRERFRWWYVKPVRARSSSSRVAEFLARLCDLQAVPNDADAPDPAPAATPAPDGTGSRQLLRAVLWSEELAGAAELTLRQTADGGFWLETESGHRRAGIRPADAAAIQVDPLGFVPEALIDIEGEHLSRLSLEAVQSEWGLARAASRTPWEVVHPYQALADPEMVRAILDALARLRVQRLIGSHPGGAAQPLQGGRFTVTLGFDRAGAWDSLDSATAGQELVLDLEMLSATGWVGARSDEGILYQLTPAQPEALLVDPLALRDRAVHAAARPDFHSVEIKSEQWRESWRRGEPEPAWVEDLLAGLADLHAVRFVTRNPAETATLGLRPPPLEIDWRIDRGGDEVPHRLQVALRPDGRGLATLDESGWVFEVHPDFARIVRSLLASVEAPR